MICTVLLVSDIQQSDLVICFSVYVYMCLCACMHAKLLQQCLTLCKPMSYSLLGSSIHGIFQPKILEWVAMPSSRESSQPWDGTQVFWITGRFCTTEPPGEAMYMCVCVCVCVCVYTCFKFFAIIGYYQILNIVPLLLIIYIVICI